MSKVPAPALALALAFGLAATAACSSTRPPPTHESPVLTHVYWVANGSPLLVWVPDRMPNDKLQTAVPPLATEIDFVFNIRLDGDRIEDTVVDGGSTTTQPAAMPPLRVSWPGMAEMPGNPPLGVVVAYNSAARFGGESSYVFARPTVPGFPSKETVTFTLDADRLTNEYGDPVKNVPDGGIVVKTNAFSVSIAPPAATVTTSYKLPIAFSNRASSASSASPFVHVTTGGAAVSSKLLPDPGDPARFYVAPADCLGAWPAGAKLTVTVDEKLTDAFGRALEKGATATFQTGAAGASTPDASCPVMIPDGGAADAGTDAAEPDAGGDAADVSVEAPAED